MGVPKFFRYTSERYPCLNELVKEYQVPDFDNMYLDMNGIIHNCSHPDDSNPHFRIKEVEIFEAIFHYISVLFQIIKPKKLFFMAIDGVAPRAKMNQQRGRRFRSAREAEDMEKQAREKGECLPTEKRFDSNCITPGTVFMARLHEQLRFFIKRKITADPLWAGCKVILSGHETPGEGEHKIMDYIRWARSQEGYDPNTRHCLYGLDADLIMLALCTHDPHFALLREEVKFGKNVQRKTTPEEINFFLLHLSLMREYLEQEFISLKEVLPFEYNMEKIVDDWVLMGFLVGNDFIPNLPNMHIQNDAMPILYKAYMKVLPTLDGYINEAGDLHLGRFEVFMQELANLDKEAFQDTFADLQFFESKTGRRPNANVRKEYKPNNDETFNVDIEEIKSGGPKSDLQALIDATDEMMLGDCEEEEEEHDDDDIYTDDKNMDDTFDMEFVLHKRDYYMNKLDYEKVTKEVLMSQAECYVRAIQWNLHYYYRGCASWSWFYPHHYAPYMSDIKGFKDFKLVYDLGAPFKPFEQLLAVLPAASKELLPSPFHKLMMGDDSPIIQYYPVNFETDLNGKKNDWEAVVLIPFIDEKNLLSAMESCYAQLSAEERQRNTHGPILMYTFTKEPLGEVLAPGYFAPLRESHAREKEIWREELYVSEQELKRGPLPNALSHLFFPGFPTMRHLNYHSRIEKSRVKVFDQLSRGENMIVMLSSPKDQQQPDLAQVADEILGHVVWVGWPHLTQAKVISVSNEQLRYHFTPAKNSEDLVVNVSAKQNVTEEKNLGNLVDQWRLQRKTILEHTMGRMGIDVGEVNIIVHAVNLKGHKYVMEKNAAFVVEPEWCTVPCGYALQAIVRDLAAHSIPALTRYSNVEDAFSPDQLVFVMTGAYYGCQAKVISASAAARTGRIKVLVSEVTEPRTTPSVNTGLTTSYMTAHHIASRCGISPQLVSRLTGTTFVIHGDKRRSDGLDGSTKSNIGLNLKFNKKNLEVIGYTRRCEMNNTWQYSARCLELITAYVDKFPDMFNRMSSSHNMDNFYEPDLWPGQVGKGKPEEVVAWLKQQDHTSAGKRECGSEVLEGGELSALANSVDTQLPQLDKDKRLSLQVKINLLYKPDLHKGNLPPDPDADYQLYDRVVNVNDIIEVPLGAKGTITAIYRQPTLNSVRLSDKLNVETSYQVMFDFAFPGGLTEDGVEGTRFYRLNASSMLNISHGRNLREEKVNQSQYQYQNNQQFQQNHTQQNQQYQQNQRGQPYQKNQYQQNQQDQPYQKNQYQQNQKNQRDQPYEKNQYQQNQQTQQTNWRSNVLRTDDGHNSAFATYTSPKKEKKPFNQNQGRSTQNQQPKLGNHAQPHPDNANIAQPENMNVAPLPPSDNMASVNQSIFQSSETGTDLLKALLKINPPSAPAELSLRPAKAASNNWGQDNKEHQRVLSTQPTQPHPTQTPRAEQNFYQPRFHSYEPRPQLSLLGAGPGPGPMPSLPFPVQPNIPNTRPNNKTTLNITANNGAAPSFYRYATPITSLAPLSPLVLPSPTALSSSAMHSPQNSHSSASENVIEYLTKTNRLVSFLGHQIPQAHPRSNIKYIPHVSQVNVPTKMICTQPNSPSFQIRPTPCMYIRQNLNPIQHVNPVQHLNVLHGYPIQYVNAVQHSNPNNNENRIQHCNPIQSIKPFHNLNNVLHGNASQAVNPVQLGSPIQNVNSVQRSQLIRNVKPFQHLNPLLTSNAIQIVNPVQHGNPIQFVNPVQHGHPVHKVNPVQRCRPVETLKPVQHLNPLLTSNAIQIVNPVQHGNPIQFVNPVQHGNPVQFVNPVQHGNPVHKVNPVHRCRPVENLKPVQHLNPVPNSNTVQNVNSVQHGNHIQNVNPLPHCNVFQNVNPSEYGQPIQHVISVHHGNSIQHVNPVQHVDNIPSSNVTIILSYPQTSQPSHTSTHAVFGVQKSLCSNVLYNSTQPQNDRVNNDRGFPKHLPQVGAREMEAATRNFNQALKGISQMEPAQHAPAPRHNQPALSHGTTNQFVPHQVLKSQRKTKNDTEGNTASSAPVTVATALPQQTTSDVAAVKQEPLKPKRRPPRNRIAANLPFKDFD